MLAHTIASRPHAASGGIPRVTETELSSLSSAILAHDVYCNAGGRSLTFDGF